MSWDQYSETPASNYITGYFLTGMAPSSVKVAGSDIMADLASRFAAMHTTGGTATAYTLTQTRQLASLVNGLEIICVPNATNTGAATFAPDGLTAKNIFANGSAVIAGMIVINVPILLKYDGTQWNLLNPQRATGSFTITLTGMASGGTGTVNYAILPDGNTAYVYVKNNVTGVSNATTMTGTGIPSVITTNWANAAMSGNMVLQDNNGPVVGCISSGLSTTTWTFGKNQTYTAGGFTASANKGIIGGVTFSYPLA